MQHLNTYHLGVVGMNDHARKNLDSLKYFELWNLFLGMAAVTSM